MRKFIYALFTPFLVWVCSIGQAVGDVPGVSISAQYAALTEGYRYYLTVYNDLDPVENYHVTSFGVHMSPTWDADVPTDWIVSPGGYVIVWETSETPAGTWYEGIPPGQSLSGFNFTATTLESQFFYRAYTHNGVYGFVEYAGYAYPEPVPEPSSLLALGMGLAAVGLPRLRRRRRG